MGKEPKTVRELAKVHARKAVTVLLDIMHDKDADNAVRASAAMAVLKEVEGGTTIGTVISRNYSGAQDPFAGVTMELITATSAAFDSVAGVIDRIESKIIKIYADPMLPETHQYQEAERSIKEGAELLSGAVRHLEGKGIAH